MKIILAPDKFKNSVSSLSFCKIVEDTISKLYPSATVLSLPMADGGDGTIEVVNFYLKGKTIKVKVDNPFFKTITASYLFSESTKTGFIEMAEASGVKVLKPHQLNCIKATTFGTGQLILDAINKGASKIILGLGGSATNDCGIGMATALGYVFLDKDKNPVKPIGSNLSLITSIITSNVHTKLKDIEFLIACDVDNPLYGKNGAAFVYSAQKGATHKEQIILDKGMQDFAKVVNAIFNTDVQKIKGAGAAGGMGMASKIFLNGTLQPGVTLVKKLSNFDEKIINADWILTGEGKLDNQTLFGKTINGVLKSAKIKQIPVAVFCGKIELTKNQIENMGISYHDDVMSLAKNLEDGMANATFYLSLLIEKFIKFLIIKK